MSHRGNPGNPADIGHTADGVLAAKLPAVTRWGRRADRAGRAYDGQLATIRADTRLSHGEMVARVAATYDHLVTTLQTLEQDWIRTLPARVGAAAVERARRPFVPRPVPEELW